MLILSAVEMDGVKLLSHTLTQVTKLGHCKGKIPLKETHKVTTYPRDQSQAWQPY
jgi:hypothetical protein